MRAVRLGGVEVRARDAWIGWGSRHVTGGELTNNTRFLVLPWVEVPHLASHLLACLARRIRADGRASMDIRFMRWKLSWIAGRFRGTCYNGQLGEAGSNSGAHPQRGIIALALRSRRVPLSPDPRLPPGVVRMLTREQAQAIYRAGEQTVVRVLLEMDARIHALEQQVRELIVRLDASEQRVKLLEDQLAKNSCQQQAAFHRWVPEARAQEPAGKERGAPRAV